MSAAPSNPNPFAGLPTKTSLMRTRRGRVVLPPVEALNNNRGLYYFSDDDLKAILKETRRQRRWWRVRSVLRVSILLGFLAWTFWIMPALALRLWPFN